MNEEVNSNVGTNDEINSNVGVNEEVIEKVEEITNYGEQKKEMFDSILEKIEKINEALELHTNVKIAVLRGEVDGSYLNYIENSLEDRIFNDVEFDGIDSKVLLEIVCPSLIGIENFEVEKLEIVTIGKHFEEEEIYIDIICTYEGRFVCMFGINEKNKKNVVKYEPKKFSRIDMIQAVCQKLGENTTAEIEQYDEYYVVEEGNSLKIFTERKVTDLVKVEETVFDKLKNKLTSLFRRNLFIKKKYLPNMELIYDNNQNRFKDFKSTSKNEAKKRMKELLTKEREITRNVNV